MATAIRYPFRHVRGWNGLLQIHQQEKQIMSTPQDGAAPASRPLDIIPTTFEIPAGYVRLPAGTRKQLGDRFLNRICNPQIGEWGWSPYTPSGTEWATIVEDGTPIIRAAPVEPPRAGTAPTAQELDDIRMVENQVTPYASQLPGTVASWDRIKARLAKLAPQEEFRGEQEEKS